MEDAGDNDYNDLQCSASVGRFYDINGGVCKFIVDPPPNQHLQQLLLERKESMYLILLIGLVKQIDLYGKLIQVQVEMLIL